jgi:hypothetical protein
MEFLGSSGAGLPSKNRCKTRRHCESSNQLMKWSLSLHKLTTSRADIAEDDI